MVGWGSSPFSHTDYVNGYLDNLSYQAFNFEAAGIKKIELLGWQILWLVNELLDHEAGLQIFLGLFQIIAYWCLLRSLNIGGIYFTIGMLLLPISSSFILFTDWYLRQGLAWSLLILAFSAYYSRFRNFIRFPSYVFLSTLAAMIHSASIFYIVIFIFSLIFYKSFVRLALKKNSISVFVIIYLTLAVMYILPFKMDAVPNFNLFIPGLHFEIYRDLEWGPSKPGFVVSFYIFVAFYIMRMSRIINYDVLKVFSVFITLLVMSISILILVNGLAGRLLMPMSLIIFASLLVVMARIKEIIPVNEKFFNFILSMAIMSLVMIQFYISIVIENGGMERF
jgi:hypothetical protein